VSYVHTVCDECGAMNDQHHPECINDEPEPFGLDEFLSMIGLPDPDACPFCAEAIRQHEWASTSQRVELVRDDNGELDIADWHDYESHDGSKDPDEPEPIYACSRYDHGWRSLHELDRDQRTQHALRHILSDYAGPATTAHRLDEIYRDPIFRGHRAHMARQERGNTITGTAWRNVTPWDARKRWERFLALDEQTMTSLAAARAEDELRAAGVLA
jgi:hypothetical protein